jgi:hypothetical protein
MSEVLGLLSLGQPGKHDAISPHRATVFHRTLVLAIPKHR